MRVRVAHSGEGHWLRVMFTFILMILSQPAVSTAVLTSDSVIISYCKAPTVVEGGNATLTCHFDHDLRNTKRGVKVVQRNPQTYDKTVLTCLWHFDDVNCIEKNGFKLVGEISSELRLINPLVTKEHAGTYACFVFDSEPGTEKKCFLNVIDGPKDPANKEKAFDDCRESILGCDEEKFPALLPVIIAASILVALAIILIIAVIVLTCPRCTLYQSGRSGNIQYTTVTHKTSDGQSVSVEP